MVICSDFGRLGEGCASERLSNEKWQGCDTGVRYANGWRNTSPCTSVSEEAGKPEGRGHKFWYQAERELQHNETQPNQPKGAVGYVTISTFRYLARCQERARLSLIWSFQEAGFHEQNSLVCLWFNSSRSVGNDRAKP
jgi:hypothetical protein